MKFSVVGHLESALPVIAEIHRAIQHELGPCWISGRLADAVAGQSLPVRLEDSPESALLSSGVDVVVLAVEDTDEILRLTRAASQSERHVAVLVPAGATTAFSFELHLLLDESPRSVFPLTGRLRLGTAGRDGIQIPAAEIQQLVVDLHDVPSSVSGMRQLQLEMLDCLQAFGFRYTQVTAIDAAGPDGAILSRLLTLSSSPTSDERLPPATINLKVKRSHSGSTVNHSLHDESVQVIRQDGTVTKFPLQSSPEVLQEIETLCQNRAGCERSMEALSASLELVDAVEKSLRRRRTVDVYFDTGSERGVFKSQMTAMGCGVLTWMMLGMIGFLIVARLTSLPPAVLSVLRTLWIAPLVLFLAAQLLLPLTRSRSRSAEQKEN
jgi:hypothetical protein